MKQKVDYYQVFWVRKINQYEKLSSMEDFYSYLVLLSLGIIFAIPSLLYKEDTGSWYLDNRLNLGLDLQGGSYLFLKFKQMS